MDRLTGLVWLLQLSLVLGTEVSGPSQSSQVTNPVPDYPYPRIVLLGQSGVGKSSLANVLAGCEPTSDDCLFPTCSGSNSCTKDTTIFAIDQSMGNWTSETYGKVTVVDTPGFGDSEGDDAPLLTNMIEVLKNVLGQANMILLCTTGQRFNPSTIKMLLELESMFGRDRLWGNVMIEVTNWHYDASNIKNRERRGVTETTTLKDINDKIMEHTHLDHPLDGIFLDSFAVFDLETDEHQHYFDKYAAQLWETASNMKPFDFYTIEDIFEQLSSCRDNVDVIKNSVTELTTLVSKNMVDIIEHSKNLRQLFVYVDSQVKALKVDVSSNSENIGKNYIAMGLKLREVKSDITKAITHANDALIGTVTAWLGGKTFRLPKGWQKCDGSPILVGPLKGQNTPNLNGEGRFLRGGSVTDSWTAQDDMVQDHRHTVSDPGHTHRDNGHTHRDSGHTHLDSGHKHEDLGHNHVYLSTNRHEIRADSNDDGPNRDQNIRYKSPTHYSMASQGTWTTDSCALPWCKGRGKANINYANASIQSAKASIQTGHSSITYRLSGLSVTGATTANIGEETRPKNIVVEWIIKVI